MRLTEAQRDRLQALEQADGRISVRQVFDDAKKKSSPLHALYDWNVQQAATRWWLHQTRLIIASVQIQVTTQDAVLKAPHYVVDMSVEGEGYRSVVALARDPASGRESLRYTLETAAGHLRRAYDLAQPLGLGAEIDRLLAEVAGVKRIIEQQQAA